MILYQRVVALSSAALSNEELAERARRGEKQYILQLWEQNKKLLFSLANKYYAKYNERFICCGVTLEDLQQECFIILLGMVKAYDPKKEYSFTTYANLQFKHHLRRILRTGGSYAENPLNVCNSLSEPATERDEDLTLADMLEDEAAELAYSDVDELIYQRQLRRALNEAMSAALTPEQIRAIVERFYNSRTIAETGAAMGVTSGQARTYEINGLKSLRRYNAVTKRLDSFREQIITEHAYKNTGINSFKYNLASSVELTTERLENLGLI